MKAIGIVGSPRKGGNTEIMTKHTLKAIEEEGIETELIPLSGLNIQGCNACMACAKKEYCSIDDDMPPIYEKMKAADAIILASPVYYGSATALIKAVMERSGYIGRSLGRVFAGKIGGPLVVARRAGQNFTICPAYPMVPDKRFLHSRFDLLECRHRQGEGGGGKGRRRHENCLEFRQECGLPGQENQKLSPTRSVLLFQKIFSGFATSFDRRGFFVCFLRV